MRISEILTEQQIRVPLVGATKEALFAEMVALALPAASDQERADALAAVHEREALASTGVGEGVAIPHGKLAHGETMVAAFGLTAGQVAYVAIDNKPVRLIFLILAPGDQPREYI